MAKHKVAELEGALLDAAVALARCTEGPNIRHHFSTHRVIGGACRAHEDAPAWSPSTDWAIGGPILDREGISTAKLQGGDEQGNVMLQWCAFMPTDSPWYIDETVVSADGRGPTPLIAAMRAYVASKFGEEVELPC